MAASDRIELPMNSAKVGWNCHKGDRQFPLARMPYATGHKSGRQAQNRTASLARHITAIYLLSACHMHPPTKAYRR